ncbi:MAG: protein adenylyltransferase SelO [Rickettsiales bacterium]
MNIFQNNFYQNFSPEFFQIINPQLFYRVKLVHYNQNLVKENEFNFGKLSKLQITKIFSGQKILSASTPIALAYAGHQFGNFVPSLGDGRAILLGEIIGKNSELFDVALKGSGRTKFSRGGDGLMTLEAGIRELIIGEALHYLQIPSSRILSLSITDEKIYRQEVNIGAVIARIMKSHIRVGTFEYFAYKGNKEAISKLCKYIINRHFLSENSATKSVADLFQNIVDSQAILIAKLQSVGFIHGVMNTDNMAICGQVLDFGPCAFLDEYNAKKVFSFIDRAGRYCFENQPKIAKWNLWILANCLSLVYENSNQLLQILDNFDEKYQQNYLQIMAKKFGLNKISHELIENFLQILQKEKLDYHQSFFKLSDDLLHQKPNLSPSENYQIWFAKWQDFLHQENGELNPNILTKITKNMQANNPYFIARNHIVKEVIDAGNNLDFKPLKDLLSALKNPYKIDEKYHKYHLPPTNNQKVFHTFCGT